MKRKPTKNIDIIDGNLKGANPQSPRFPLFGMSQFTLEECDMLVEIVRYAMIQSLIERGQLKLGVTTLYLKVDQTGRLFISRKEPYVLENLLENNEDPLNLMSFLEPHHLKRLRLIKEKHGNVQKDSS